jgi:glycosyltransferase involved in cell wall biosynthesis
LRILLPTHYRLHGGGIARVVEGLEQSLPGVLGPDDELVALPTPTGHRAEALAGIGGVRGASARLAYEQLTLPRAARGADTVHLCDARPILASRRPFVVQVHDVAYLDHPEWFSSASSRYKALMLRAVVACRPAAVVCDSSFTRERLLHHHPGLGRRAIVAVIHPGLTRPAGPATPPDAGESPYFLTVSTIEPRKNHLGLLAAFRAARARGLDLRWKVAGLAGHRSDEILPALRAADGVDVLGWVSPERLERLWAGARLTAVPSFVEGFGYPPLEAMARGVPVLYGTGSAMDETLADAAIGLPADDVGAWTDALLRLAGDEAERERLIALGRGRIERFTWGRAAAAVRDLHHSVL